MIKLLRRLLGTGKSNTSSAIITTLAGIPLSQLSNYEGYLQAGTRKVWASWKACDIVANAVGNTPYIVSRVNSVKPVNLPDLQQILTYPNTFQTFRELLYLLAMHLKLTGSGYLFKSQATLSGDKPRELLALNPKRMQIIPDRENDGIRGYIYTSGGVRIPLDPEEVIHFRRPHPDNDYFGLGDVEAGEDLFNEHINRNTWQKQFWKNGAAPSSIMVLEDQQPDETSWKEAKRRWQAEYGGAENAGKTAWLNGKWRKEQLGLSAKDMENIESAKWNVEQIFMQHGVPLSVAGVRDAANFATADIDNGRFKEYTVLPLVLLLEDTLNTDLVQGWGKDLKLKFNLSGLINVGKIVSEIAPGFDRGWFSVNEARMMLGLEPDDTNTLWDQHFILAGLVPLDLSGVADLQQVDQQAQQTVQRAVNAALATKRNDENKKTDQPTKSQTSSKVTITV